MTENVLFCACANSDVIPEEVKREVHASLAAERPDAVVVADLCELAARGDPLLRRLVDSGPLTVVACHPRAVSWLLKRAGAEPLPASLKVVNMRCAAADELLAELFDRRPEPSRVRALPAAEPGAWAPWFPVIDYDRCGNCAQCLSFCLFGVYAKGGDERVEVVAPANCKNNCPACARICPEAAIIFPKVRDDAINGAPITDEEAVKANIKINVEKILGNDVYAALAERKKKRRQILIRQEQMQRAVAERAAHTGED